MVGVHVSENSWELTYCKSVGVFDKIIIPLALVGCEIVTATSYPMCTCGIIKYVAHTWEYLPSAGG